MEHLVKNLGLIRHFSPCTVFGTQTHPESHELSSSRSHDRIVQNTRVASVRAARSQRMVFIRKNFGWQCRLGEEIALIQQNGLPRTGARSRNVLSGGVYRP